MPTIEQSDPDLGFVESARSAFAFLERLYAFEITRTEPTLVRYESADVFVNVFHGRRSREVGVEIGLLSAEHGFGLSVLQEIHPNDTNSKNSRPTCTSREAVAAALGDHAHLLERIGGSALVGDAAEYGRLQAHMSSYWDQRNLDGIRERAWAAFGAKDYARVVELIARYEKYLSPAERKKLEIARSRAKA